MALGSATFTDIGAAVGDIFAAKGDAYKAEGDRLEATQYVEAEQLANQNAQFTANSTAIQEAQKARSIEQTQGSIQADTAANGLAEAGSSVDVLRDSASQGALSQAVLGQQGLITEAGYQEQAQSYQTMSQVSQLSAQAEDTAAQGAKDAAAFSGIAAVATLFTPPGT